ncbi:hypothetical protein KDW49_22380 [Burkholderia dolosa]|uniref:hypothetical protein n=1 Tax=Burkholderia dolosa TaxID=152500 RepID=UPI001BA1F43D|nr:hypothetical protein [Burkholderia dolosa]MBR8303459.1 hypothetical protein [Burkholderia dolosa]
MASSQDASFFERLVAPMLRHLRYIAKLTKGEHSVDDLKNEAWIIAEEIKGERGATVEPEDAELQESVIARLHKLFGRFVNRTMRFAVRLDQEDVDDSGDARENSVAARLAAPVHYEPLAVIEREEEVKETARVIASQFSQAVAYYQMFDHFDGDSSALASYLAVASCTLRRRVRRVERTARDQPSVFDGVAKVPFDFMARPGEWHHKPCVNNFRHVCGRAHHAQLHLFLKYGKIFGPVRGRMQSVEM